MDSDIVPIIERHEETLRQAMLAGDVPVLETLLADDLLFVTDTGAIVGKQADLAAHRAGLLRLTAMEPSQLEVRAYGSTAVVSVRMLVVGSYEGEEFAGPFRYLRVWMPFGDGWQVVAGNVTPIAD
jgi:hypothetical protein